MHVGGVAVGDLPLPNPAPDWIANKCWGELCRASDLGPAWQGLAAHVAGMCVDSRLALHSVQLTGLAKALVLLLRRSDGTLSLLCTS